MARPGDDPNPNEDASFRTRLGALDKRIRAAKGVERPDIHAQRGSAMGAAFRITADLLAGVIVGAFIGWWLDHWLDTSPIFLVVFFVLGSAAGILNVMRSAKRMQSGSAASGAVETETRREHDAGR
jgi:ATP synthase protein I